MGNKSRRTALFAQSWWHAVPCLLVLLLLDLGCSSSRQPSVPVWPDVSEVERITATLTGSTTPNPAIAEFDIPMEHHATILRLLNSPIALNHPLYGTESASLHIHCKERVLEVRLIYGGKGPLEFTLEGIPCVRSGDYVGEHGEKYLPEVLTFEGVLRAIHDRDMKKMHKYLNALDRSAGRNVAQKE